MGRKAHASYRISRYTIAFGEQTIWNYFHFRCFRTLILPENYKIKNTNKGKAYFSFVFFLLFTILYKFPLAFFTIFCYNMLNRQKLILNRYLTDHS